MSTGQPWRILRVVIAVLAVGVLAHGLHAATGIGSDSLFADWVYNLLMWSAVALCAARPLAIRAERGAWAFLAASLAVWAAADLTWTAALQPRRGPAVPERREDIPIGARVIAVCDTYDAITSKRSYADAQSHEEALAELQRCAGTQFDPVAVKAFCAANPAALSAVPVIAA